MRQNPATDSASQSTQLPIIRRFILPLPSVPTRTRLGIYTNQIVMRVLGTIMSAGFFAIGIFALFYAPADIDQIAAERAFGFGIASLVAGGWALLVSWFDSDLTNVWCKPPMPLSGSRPSTAPTDNESVTASGASVQGASTQNTPDQNTSKQNTLR